MGKSQFFIAGGMLFSFAVIISAIGLSYQRISTTGRATGRSSQVTRTISAFNSYIFASPITAPADGESPIRVQVNLLNSQGLGIKEVEVRLLADPKLTIIPLVAVSDPYGRVFFDVSTKDSGNYTIKAAASSRVLTSEAKISFL